MHSFEIFLATTVVFWGSGTLGYTLLEYRLGHKKLVSRVFRVDSSVYNSFHSFRFTRSLKTSCGYHSCAHLSTPHLPCALTLFSRSFLQLLFLRRSIYPRDSSDPSPLIFIQHSMVGHDQRSSKVEFLQGDPKDCETILVPDVNVYCYYWWDDHSFHFACAVRVAGEWVRLGCDFPFVVSGVFQKRIIVG